MTEAKAPWDDETTQPVVPVPPPEHPRPLTYQERVHLFGRFTFTHDPMPGNPEHVEIEHAWRRDNIVPVVVPQLDGRRVPVNRHVAAQFLRLWAAWEAAGLRDRVLTFDGAFVSRFKRFRGTLHERLQKSRLAGGESLSNHCYGTAFDINWRWNKLGDEPAALGEHGCVRELIPLAEAHGFAWGGYFKSRPDGMHFEAYRVLP